MKKAFAGVLLIAAVLIIILTGTSFKKNPGLNYLAQKRDNIISCGSIQTDISPNENGKFIPVLEGLGHHRYIISTKNGTQK